MDPQQVLSIGRDGLMSLITVCAPLLLTVMAVGLVAWVLLRRRWPDTGQHITAH